MSTTIAGYNKAQSAPDRRICIQLMTLIDAYLAGAERKIWHAHPVWFLEGNPIVGYSKQKIGVRMMFWSGASFDEALLKPGTGKFKDASITYLTESDIVEADVRRWLAKAALIQWDYKNIVKRKGVLERLK
jgi:hypothetical protein